MECAEISKLRSEDLLALADAINMLNDDDALELFKNTLPGSSASFMQLQVSAASLRSQAQSGWCKRRVSNVTLEADEGR